jgi:hypothetical protein
MMSKESAPVKGFGSFWARWGIDYQKKGQLLPTEITRSP